MRGHARVVIIGGGAMGCSLLYHLCHLGWRDCVLVEKNELTAGSTWHAAGLCTHFAHNITIMNMRAHSVRLYGGILEAETGQPVSFHQCGALRVTRSRDRMDEFRHVQGIGRFAGFDFNILSPVELKAIYPLVELDGLLGAIHEPLDGYVDPSQATHAMAKGARDLGAEIYRNTPVHGIDATAGGEWRVHTRGGDITAEIIVNAAGTWCREIGAMMGIDLPVVPMLHQYLVMDRVAAFADLDRELPMIRDPEESWYLRQERDGVIIGPYEANGTPWSIDGVPRSFGMELLPPDLDRIEAIAACAMARVPAVADAGIKTIVNGPITFTPDANPLIGPAFGLRNAYLLTGSSMGVMEGGGAGKFLAEWMVGSEPPMDALAVDARRFGGYADRDYRVAKAVECFAAQFGVHYPYEERPAGRPKLTTPAHDVLKKKGAVMGFVYGWERPNWFSNKPDDTSRLSFTRSNWFAPVREECARIAEGVALADLSVFSKFRITGAGAARFMDTLGANRPPGPPGSIGLTHCLTLSGGVISEFTVTRLVDEEFYLTSAAAARRQDWDLLLQHGRAHPDTRAQDMTRNIGVLGLMGPHSGALMRTLTDAGLDNDVFPWLTARRIVVADVPVTALRVSYVGELGWELHHDMHDQTALLDRLCEAGKQFDLGFYGAFAMNALRLEKGYRAWGVDLTTERTPLEAGLGRFVKIDDREFAGRAALLRRAERADRWSMALLELDEYEIDPFYSHTVYARDSPVGIVTSGAYGHRVKKPLALAYFRQPPANDDLWVSLLGKKIAARVLQHPPYDPDNLRPKG